MIGWSVAAGLLVGLVLLALRDVLPHAFTDDPAVIERAEALWPLFALMQPLERRSCSRSTASSSAPATPLPRAGDARRRVAAYVPFALLALAEGWGVRGVWLGLLALMLVRLVDAAASASPAALGRRRRAA